MIDFNDRIAALDDALNNKIIALDYAGTLQETMPLLREMVKALSEAQAENERLRDGIGRAVSDLSDWYETDDASKSIFEIKLALEALHDA